MAPFLYDDIVKDQLLEPRTLADGEGGRPVLEYAGAVQMRRSNEQRKLTQVIQGAWLSPKATCQAGSSDWKNSSGWKNVRTVNAFRRRKETRARKTRRTDGGVERRAEKREAAGEGSLRSGSEDSTLDKEGVEEALHRRRTSDMIAVDLASK